MMNAAQTGFHSKSTMLHRVCTMIIQYQKCNCTINGDGQCPSNVEGVARCPKVAGHVQFAATLTFESCLKLSLTLTLHLRPKIIMETSYGTK